MDPGRCQRSPFMSAHNSNPLCITECGVIWVMYTSSSRSIKGWHCLCTEGP